jgi:hypothetical protein
MTWNLNDEGESEEVVTCDLCGEDDGPGDDDVVTQLVKRSEDGVHLAYGHGQCGIDFGYELG